MRLPAHALRRVVSDAKEQERIFYKFIGCYSVRLRLRYDCLRSLRVRQEQLKKNVLIILMIINAKILDSMGIITYNNVEECDVAKHFSE